MVKFLKIGLYPRICFVMVISFITLYSCTKEDNKQGADVTNSFTLFKLDNKNNSADLTATDTLSSMSGVAGKYIPVTGATGAANGLESIKMDLLTLGDSLLNSITVTSFYRPEYHVINAQLNIPTSQKGQVYKVTVTVIDKTGATVGTKSFFGEDVVTCDPLPPCLVNNQITVMVETPPGTPESEDLYLFGSLNGWIRGDPAYQLHKNPDVANCYCVSIPFPPGYTDWQVGEVYVTRGLYENDAVNNDNSSFIVNYTSTDLGPLWKVKVLKWRDR